MSKIPPSMRRPDRIYGWRDGQLSIARFYGGCSINGCMYVVDTEDPQEPLVRVDLLDAEKANRVQQEKDKRQFEALKAAMAQGTLI